MYRLTVEDLPKELTADIIDILAIMANEFPKTTKHWEIVSKELEKREVLSIVLDRAEELKDEQRKVQESAKSEAQKAKEKAWWEKYHADKDPHKFYGNMGQPETAQEFKNRYGVWPPNYKPEEGEE
jgi:hypothetical protein